MKFEEDERPNIWNSHAVSSAASGAGGLESGGQVGLVLVVERCAYRVVQENSLAGRIETLF